MRFLEDLFCQVDEFCQRFEPEWQRQQLLNQPGTRRRHVLSLSEIMTFFIAFHQSSYRNLVVFHLCA